VKRSRLLPLLLVPVVALGVASCSSGGSSDASASASASSDAASCPTSGSVTKAISTTAGEVGKTDPVLKVGGTTTKSVQARTLTKGDGPAVSKTDIARVAYSVFDTKTGKMLGAFGYKTGDPQNIDLSSASSTGFADELKCAHQGDRFVVAGSASKLGFSGSDNYAVVADVVSFPLKADGAKQSAPADVPTVTDGKGGEPEIAKGSGTAPTETKVATLKQGTGAAVATNDSVIVQYKGVLFKNGKEFDSSWSRGKPSVFPTVAEGSLIKGFVTGLVGQKVGSQVEIVVPPADGYGDSDQNGIPGGSTLVFVVDILAKSTPAS
jgi:FKBP-type peptidyl-prolyl cis-trans isomerase